MMIIDSHTHTFPARIAPQVIPALQAKANTRAYTAGTDDALRASMERAGIALSILLPVMTNSEQVQKLNDIALKKNESTADTGILSLGGMHPDYADYAAELRRIADCGITGIKLHPAYQGVDLDDVRYLRIIEKAAELDLAVVIHAGLDIGIMHHNFATVAQIQRVLKELTPPKFVLAHMGGWKDWDKVEQELCGEKVYLDTSFSLGAYTPPDGCFEPEEKRKLLSQEQFVRIVKKHGADKILFGSDSPWSDQTQSVAQMKACGFMPEQEDKLFLRNAQEVFGLADKQISG